ncbi:MAG: SDR family oxidoreductase [Sphingomonadales bacterium]|nr:SDR family oxidoreductase [Sphingomonadales bacterium]
MSGIFTLDGKVALVTGAASGIGTGIAEILAEAGAHVIVADINEEGVAHTVELLHAAGHRADGVTVDLSDEHSIVRAVAEVVASHGAPWVLVNNAGVQDREYLLEESVAGWDRTQAINARGPFLMTREVGRAMVAAGQGGRIVNIASMTIHGMMTKGTAAYIASKGAVAALTSQTALELAEHGITANSVLPGAVMTPGAMAAKGPPTEGPACRRGVFGMNDPRDIGAAVLFFATPAARMVTNQRLAVDAGWSLS